MRRPLPSLLAPGLLALGSLLALASAAEAQVTVRIDRAPTQVRPGETFEVAWTVTSPDPIALTTVAWGEQAGRWDKLGSLRTGASGTTFRTNLSAPAQPGTMHWVVFVKSGPARGTTAERRIAVSTAPVPTPNPPAAPSALRADATSPTQVDLAWTDNADDERNYFVERRAGTGAFARVAALAANSVAYSDRAVAAATTYEYRVVAGNDIGFSAPSNVVGVTTPQPQPQPQAPAAPSNLRATAASGTRVDLSWRDESTNETGFVVGRRDAGSTGTFAQVAQVAANVTTYADAGVQAGRGYEYSVYALNAVGTSAGTNVVAVSTPAPTPSNVVTATRVETPALAIPDDDATGATSRLVVTGAGSIQSLEVTVDVRHPWRGDLVLRLTSPRGTTITLFDPADDDQNDDVRGAFPGQLAPAQPLARFQGEEVRGTWTLVAVDGAAQDEGTIAQWSLRATVGPSANPPAYGLEQRVPVTTLRFPLGGSTASPPSSLRPVRAFPNLSFRSPVLLTSAPDGRDRIFVVEQQGTIKVFANDDAVAAAGTFLDIRSRVASGGEMGLLGLAFDPGFAQNGTFYVNYTASGPQRTVVSRFRVTGADPNRADPASEQVVLQVNQPYSNHNGGMIAFGQDGMLYVGMGDGGSGGDPHGHGQDRSSLLAKMLRLDVRNQTTYRVPADNPFVGQANVRGEIWAYGLRNPWRWSFDRVTGELWAGDVGQNAREEIDIVRRGGNYGWAIREGKIAYQGGTAAGAIDPVHDYTTSQGRTVIGGYVYRGTRLAGLQGVYVYGDYGSGRVWTLKWNGTALDFNREVAQVPSVCSFGEDQHGELFAVSYNGELFRFELNSSAPPAAVFPRLLSETGIFQDLARLEPNPGIIEYEVASPLWSDAAVKRRWIALPGSAQIGWSANGNWTFPVGTVFVKHFGLELSVGNPGTERRLETRVLIHEQAGWRGYTYKWNAQQTDADLLPGGDQETYQVQDPQAPGGSRQQTWSFPGRADCMSCHTQAAGFVLGARTGQINREFAYPAMRDNQLRSWNHIRLFSQDIGPHAGLEAWTDPKDAGAPLSARARSYLAANCMQCHQPGGPTPHDLDLRWGTPRAAMNVINVRPNGGDLGIPNALIVAERERARSVLYDRLGRRDSRGMPQLGSNVVDAFGLDLIGQWIDAGAP